MNALPHSGEARTPAAVVRVEQARRARPNGWWGMALFVATEATLFGTIIGTYFYLRFNNLHWPPPGVPEPKLTLPLVLTGLLVATSVPVQFAVATQDGHLWHTVRFAQQNWQKAGDMAGVLNITGQVQALAAAPGCNAL